MAINWLVDWLIDWLCRLWGFFLLGGRWDWLIDWLVDWLIDWYIDCVDYGAATGRWMSWTLELPPYSWSRYSQVISTLCIPGHTDKSLLFTLSHWLIVNRLTIFVLCVSKCCRIASQNTLVYIVKAHFKGRRNQQPKSGLDETANGVIRWRLQEFLQRIVSKSIWRTAFQHSLKCWLSV